MQGPETLLFLLILIGGRGTLRPSPFFWCLNLPFCSCLASVIPSGACQQLDGLARRRKVRKKENPSSFMLLQREAGVGMMLRSFRSWGW